MFQRQSPLTVCYEFRGVHPERRLSSVVQVLVSWCSVRLKQQAVFHDRRYPRIQTASYEKAYQWSMSSHHLVDWDSSITEELTKPLLNKTEYTELCICCK